MVSVRRTWHRTLVTLAVAAALTACAEDESWPAAAEFEHQTIEQREAAQDATTDCEPTAGSVEECDGLDNDCDGKIDNIAPGVCTDGSSCTDDSCDSNSNLCQHLYENQNGKGCSDGNACSVGDLCSQGVCTPGPPTTCNDGNDCTVDICDDKTGKCVYNAKDGLACDDGNKCKTDMACSSGTCVGGKAKGCDDANACTKDACSPQVGCTNVNKPDKTACGPAMACASGICAQVSCTVTVTTVAGKIHSGRIVEESPDKLVLRSANGNRPLITLLKTDVDEVAPSKTSSMPDALVDQLADRQQFLDLLRYLMELKASASRPVEAAVVKSPASKLSEELTGLVLMDELQCHACHGDLGAKSMAPAKQAPKLAWANGRVNPKYIERFIADPEHVKPGTTMPDVMAGLAPDLRRKAAREITHYLSSLSKAKFRTQPLDVAAAHFGGELFHSVGCVACHSPRAENGAEKLRNESVPLGSINRKYNLDGLVAFLEDPHVVRPSGRMPNMTLTHWEAVSIANYLLGGPADREPTTEFQVDRSLAEKGKVQFAQLGCAQCHLSGGDRPERVYSTFANVQAEKGCLSGDVGEWPRYKLDESQLKAIRVAIKREPKELTKQEQLAVTLATFNCTVCHQRGNLGGVSGERDQYFQTANPNLGPQGRVPPRLTAVGAKLKPKWTRQVLVSGRKIRPYMKTRMPQYGTDNVAHLADLFQSIDQLSKTEFAEFSDQKQMRNDGHKLAGTDGLNCVACHNFQQKPATTMPGVDLTEMAERLQQNWFYHYMRAPQQLSTNTVMPSFWPGGRAIRKDVLDGDPGQQIEALWQYLLDGRQARAPRGLVREPILLVASDEAVILRRNYSGIGKRGIGVGFPGQVNLAFDAEQMRLAMIWKGDFADPGSAWRGQGSGSVRPLGSDLIRLSAGPNVDNATAPWAVDPGRPPKHRFKGYYLDDLQRPTFMYRFDGIDVEDYSIDEKDSESGAAFIRRTLTFGSEVKREDVAFWSATDQDIMMEADGSFLIGKKLRIRVVGKQRGGIVKAMKGGRLRIPLTLPKGTSKLVLDYSW